RQDLECKHRELARVGVVHKKLAAHVGKYDGIFVRLCLLWHCIESPGTEPPSTVSEKCARRVADFLAHFLFPHAVAFYTDVYGLSRKERRLPPRARTGAADKPGHSAGRPENAGAKAV